MSDLKVKMYSDPNREWRPNLAPLVEQGFRENNCQIVDDLKEASFLFARDPNGYEQMFLDAKEYQKTSILNILDIPDPQTAEKWRKYINAASAITAISNTTANDVNKYYGIDPFVIYEVVKPMINLNLEMPIRYKDNLRFLYNGRISDNKRRGLAVELVKNFFEERQLVTVGVDFDDFGKYAGVVEDSWLNYYYNLCNYVLVPSSFGGIELPIIQALILGKFPLVCNDCLCAMEFAPEFSAPPNVTGLYNKIEEIEENLDKYTEIAQDYQKKYKEQFSGKSVCEGIIHTYERALEQEKECNYGN